MAIVFFMPAVVVVSAIQQAGGGVPRYFLGVPLALIAGACAVLLDWHTFKLLALRSQQWTGRGQAITGIVFLSPQLILMAAGAAVGFRFSQWIVDLAPNP